MISAQFLWGSVLLRGELQKYAKKSNFENVESALYSTSVSMPLRYAQGNAKNLDNVVSKLITYKFKLFKILDYTLFYHVN